MPRRTNLFQDVVAIIHEHLAGEADIERSAMLPNRLTGELREVDVVLRSRTGPGYETVIGIEAVGRGRPAAVDWVESMVAKHANLPTDKVVLVAENGFTEQARNLAVAESMVPLEPAALDEPNLALRVLSSLRSLWPKVVQLTPLSARLRIEIGADEFEVIQAPPNLDIFFADHSHVELLPLLHAFIGRNLERIIEQINLRDIVDDVDTHAILDIGPGWTYRDDGEELSFCVKRHIAERDLEMCRVDSMTVVLRAVIQVTEIEMHSRRLADLGIDFAYGEGFVGERRALIVVTENEEGGTLTVHPGGG